MQGNHREYGQKQQSAPGRYALLIVHEPEDGHTTAAKQNRQIKSCCVRLAPEYFCGRPDRQRRHNRDATHHRRWPGMAFPFRGGIIDDAKPFSDRPRKNANGYREHDRQIVKQHRQPRSG